MWIKALSVGSRYLDGNVLSNNNGMYSNNSLAHRINQSSSSLVGSNVLFNALGLMSMNRISSTNVTCFVTPSSTTLDTATSTIISSNNQFIFRSATSYATQQVAVYGMGASLVTENTDFSTYLTTYLNSL
jgi:hypothetical protein